MITSILLADMFAEIEMKGERVAHVLFREAVGVLAGSPVWDAEFVEDATVDAGVIVLKSELTTMQFVYWAPPSSITDGHFWVLKRICANGGGLWKCSQCDLSAESKNVVGFRVAIPHWADLKEDSCWQRVVDQVHAR